MGKVSRPSFLTIKLSHTGVSRSKVVGYMGDSERGEMQRTRAVVQRITFNKVSAVVAPDAPDSESRRPNLKTISPVLTFCQK